MPKVPEVPNVPEVPKVLGVSKQLGLTRLPDGVLIFISEKYNTKLKT